MARNAPRFRYSALPTSQPREDLVTSLGSEDARTSASEGMEASDEFEALLRKDTAARPVVGCCTKCCFVFSISGVLFLLFIGMLLRSETLYILPETEGSEKRDLGNATLGAMGIYAGFTVLSGSYWLKKLFDEWRVLRYQRMKYEL